MDRIGYYLADVCREVREAAGKNQNFIAGEIGSGIDKVKNFELQKIRWSPDTDLLVDTYAKLAAVPPTELWQTAIDRWRESQSREQAGVAPDARNGSDTAAQAGSGRRLQRSVRSESPVRPKKAGEDQRRKSG